MALLETGKGVGKERVECLTMASRQLNPSLLA